MKKYLQGLLYTILLSSALNPALAQKPFKKDFLATNSFIKYHDYYRFGYSVRITAGNWIPNNNRSLLGNHSYIGIQGSLWETEVLSIRIAFEGTNNHHPDTKTLYTHYQYSTPILSDTLYDITRGYAEIEYSFYHYKILTFGAGIDLGSSSITFSRDSSKHEYKSQSFMAAFYLGTKLYVRPWLPVFFQAKYSYLNHYNQNGTSLKGDAISYNAGVCFIIPLNENPKKSKKK
jgi:hypothetical protein